MNRRTNSRVFGVMAARSCAGVTLNSVLSVVCKITGFAPASLTISGVAQPDGAGMMTLFPPASQVARMVL